MNDVSDTCGLSRTHWAGAPSVMPMADEKFFQRSAALGTYALEDSPLIAAFMRDDINPSVALTDNEDD